MSDSRFVPGRDDLVDAGFLLVLSVIALVGFRTTYADSHYLIAGGAGLLLGLAVAYLAVSLRQPIITVAAITVGIFFLLGSAIALHGNGALPTPTALKNLTDAGIHGWKDLLTTLPPVDTDGPLLVIPYILGLAAGSAGHTLARRFQRPLVAAITPICLLIAVILLGTAQPAARLLQGALFGVLLLLWLSIRAQRVRPTVTNGTGRRVRVITSAVLLVAATVGAIAAAPHLPGSGTTRTVLRAHVQPPFDLNQYPSPLVGFRKYTKDANLVWDQTLFTVKGLPSGDRVRIATLDDYNGLVWSASNGTVVTAANSAPDTFQRVGTRIPSALPAAAQATKATVTITISSAYAAYSDLNAWLPSPGAVTKVVFTGANSSQNKESFRYNLYTDSGVVAHRLSAGDTVTVSALVPHAAFSADDSSAGSSQLSSGASDFTSPSATKWSQKSANPMQAILNVAQHMRSTGAYSDGGDGQGEYLPGHGVGNITAFLNRSQLVGDDEQYAAAFALMVNQLGVPARVVFGATPEADGSVKGKDVHAWVEVEVASAGWVAIPQTKFMPDTSKKPDTQPPQAVQDASAAVVPPPNPTRPPSSLDDLSQVEADSQAAQKKQSHQPLLEHSWQLPGFVVATAKYGGPPILLVLVVCGSIIGVKAWRRRRRQRRGRGSTRVLHGWAELLDTVRDLGADVPTRVTRREQAQALRSYALTPMAHEADRAIFDVTAPDDEQAAQYWQKVHAMRKQLRSELSMWRRFRSAVSLRSLRPRFGESGS